MTAQFSAPSRWTENTPQRIAMARAAGTTVGLATWVSWLVTGDYTLVNAFFRYPNAIFTLAISSIGALLCFQAWSRLDAKEPLRTAWFWLLLASLSHLLGRTLGLPLQPPLLREYGVIVAGPLHMSLLLAGLLNVLVHCRRLGLLRRLAAIDYVLLAVAGGFMLRSLAGISTFIDAGKEVSFSRSALWTSDPLILLLLASAVAIRRSVVPLGHGLLANCWRSYIAGIVLTSIGSASAWCMDCSTTPLWTSLGWYVWLVSDCAFSLGPAFQVAALDHARSRARVFGAFADVAFWRVP